MFNNSPPGSLPSTPSQAHTPTPPPGPRTELSIDPDLIPRTDELKISLAFYRALQDANLENGDLDEDEVNRLRNPVQHVDEIDDKDVLLSLKLFLSTTRASNQVYADVRTSMQEVYPEHEILSLDKIKKKIAELTGVTPIVHDMCPNTCLAYTGPFADLEACPTCEGPRYDQDIFLSSGGRKKVARQHFYTMPLGPQLQALWRTLNGAREMGYRARQTELIIEELEENDGYIDVYEDIYHAQEYLDAVRRGDISPNDVVITFSMDGAQLYEDKQSDCWIYIWVIFNLSPDRRYKRKYVVPGGIIPGPNNPKNTDSFLFPGFHHVCGLMKDGLGVWDASIDRTFMSRPFLYCFCADGPGSVHFTGLVGHHGAYPCRLYCGLKGRHKPRAPHYYPALQKPHNYTVQACSHDDIDPASIAGCSPTLYVQNMEYLLQSRNPTNFKDRRKETGIGGLSLLSAFPATSRLPVPAGFPGDAMHSSTLNLGELFIPLWRGTFNCDKTDSVASWEWVSLADDDAWNAHGAAVEACRPFIPGTFDHAPRNIAAKISSGYKAKEWQGYLYGLAPALLHGILPLKYWKNFCRLVYVVRIVHQRQIPRSQVLEAHEMIQKFHIEFEEIYVRRRVDRLHMVRPCLHAILHMPSETVRVGPPPLYSTWTMERMVGDLGGEIRQPSNPYANLSERALLRCQINTLKSLFPGIEPGSAKQNDLPMYSEDLGDGYAFLRA